MKLYRNGNIILLLLISIYCIYAGIFIYQTSFVIEGERYFSLFDDAMIGMRYAENLAKGNGLVWNPGGEKVEGFTNLLWVLYMSIFHLFPIPKSKISLLIQLTGVLLLVINFIWVKKISLRVSAGSTFVSITAMFLTAFYYPLNNWGLQGMEVGLLTLLITLSVWNALESLENNVFPWLCYVLLGIGILVRNDMGIAYVGLLLGLSIVDKANIKKNIIIGLSILVIICLLQTIFRLYYYHDILPNTYYLKMTGYPLIFRVSRGLIAYVYFVFNTNIVLFLMPFILLLLKKKNKNANINIFIIIFIMQSLYSIYVGGDVWEAVGNRYVTVVMPLFFILFAYSIYLVKADFTEVFLKKYHSRFNNYILAAFLLIALINFNMLQGGRSMLRLFLLEPPLHVAENKEMVKIARLLNKITTSEAKIGVVWAGATPYHAQRYCIEFLGKNDREISHEPMKEFSGLKQLNSFIPGHMKYNYGYSIAVLKPDVIPHIWELPGLPPEADKILQANNYVAYNLDPKLFLLADSPNVLWDKVASLYLKTTR